MPRIAMGELRLGDVVRRSDGRFGIVLTPHCHLAIQEGEATPRATSALIAWAVPAADVLADLKWSGNADDKRERLRKRLQSPPETGSPTGRHWFLPAFLDIPSLYCDFTDLEPVPIADLNSPTMFALLATLDAPYAEAMQSCFLRFYSAVGLPSLRLDPYLAFIPAPAPAK
jgi:hypothetical protein